MGGAFTSPGGLRPARAVGISGMLNRAHKRLAEIHRPLIPLAMAIIVGIAAGAWRPGYVVATMIGALLSAGWIVSHVVRRRGSLWPPLLFCLLAGYLSIQPWLCAPMPENHVSRFADTGLWHIEGRVIGRPHEKLGRWKWDLATTRLSRENRNIVVCGRIVVTARGQLASLSRGDAISFSGRLRSIRNFANPGGFDYRRFMALKTIGVRSYARANSLTVEERRGPDPWARSVDDIRTRLSSAMDACLTRFSADTQALLKVLLLGERHQISKRLRNQFNRAGVGHVLAISGLHIGMVAAMAFGLARWILTTLPPIRRHGWTRKGAALFSLLAVAAYGVLAGLSPSTQRAMIMVAVFMAHHWVGRRHEWANALALAALVIVVVHPPSLLSISFQLSFAAVLALIVGLDRSGVESKAPADGGLRRFGRRLFSMLRVSFLAILGTLPLVLYYFNQASSVGLATNMVVVPAVGLLVVPAGLMGVIWAFLNPQVSALCWQVAAWAMEGVGWLVELAAQWPYSAFKSVTPTCLEIALYYLSAAFLLTWKRLPGKGVILALLVTLWGVDAGYWYHQRFGSRDLKVTVIDVGQGSANLLQLPGGYIALVDGGGFSDNRYLDVGERIIAPLLWRHKIKTVDLVVLTHPNSDHLNGLLYILEHFNVREVWSNGEPASTQGYKAWQHLIARQGIPSPDLQQITTREDRGRIGPGRIGIDIEVLGPPSNFLHTQATESWRNANNNSLVLRIGYQGVTLLLSGDIGIAAEADLLARHGPHALRSTILLAPHHGSRGSSSPAFIKAVSPRETVISCGWQNWFGFPHPDVVRRLEAVGSRIWTTAEHGAVQIVIGEKGYEINAWR